MDEETELSPKREKFCRLYSTESEFFGNGVQSYIEAYEPDQSKPNWYKSACSSASRMLGNVKVIARINEILTETGLNDAFIDKQLSFLIAQHADFTNKLGAIKEYNKLKQRIIDKWEGEIKLPQPILAGIANEVHSNNSTTEDSSAQKAS